jgi:WD40 repeat protein
MEPLTIYRGHSAIVEVCLNPCLFGLTIQFLNVYATGRGLALPARVNFCFSWRRPSAFVVRLEYWRYLHLFMILKKNYARRWDCRGTGSGSAKPTARVEAHEAEVNAVAFAPFNENILITGSADKVCRTSFCRSSPRAECDSA